MAKPLSRKYAEEYESDNGFVEDAAAPRSKKLKAGSSSDHKEKSSSRRDLASGVQKDDEGNEYWELSGKRRVQISEFKGSTFVSIREFYEKDGKSLPGKKGISLAIDQYKTLIEILPQIETTLSAKGISVPRPEYGESGGAVRRVGQRSRISGEENDGDDDDDDGGERPERSDSRAKDKSGRLKAKKNHEATSDEDSG